MGKGLRGDFIGFTFNNIHSSTLGITRVSNGSRYEEDLLPTFQDKVVDSPGTDGTYYFGSYYKQKVFNIQIAFDNLSEEQLRRLKQVFSDKEIHELWFDETPYKAYNVKITGTPNLKYICFDKKIGDNLFVRTYKGEGTLSFIAFYPLAHSRFKYSDEFDIGYANKNEWLGASGIPMKGKLNSLVKINNDKRMFILWNAGDIPTDFKLRLFFNNNSTELSSGSIQIGKKGLYLNKISKKEKDEGIEIDTKLELIQGFKKSGGKIILTGNIYNEYIKTGNFFKIEKGGSIMNLKGLYGNKDTEHKSEIDYQYWYF